MTALKAKRLAIARNTLLAELFAVYLTRKFADIGLFIWALASRSSLTESEIFRIFDNTEFLVIVLLSVFQVILAFIINARTLKRTIDYTGGE